MNTAQPQEEASVFWGVAGVQVSPFLCPRAGLGVSDPAVQRWLPGTAHGEQAPGKEISSRLHLE